MIQQGSLLAALNAIGIDAEVQVTLDGIPLDIIGVRYDDLRGVIVLALDDDQSRDATRRFVAGASAALTADTVQEHAVRRNSRGHFELLHE
jgi:hypothetical protein